jgi:nucleoside-diphosphate-sugar epimerase
MRVFLTGATGFIGTAVVRELLAAGHEVLGLARSDAAADTLSLMGKNGRVMAHRGDLTDTASLVSGARACDGVIHTAFDHGFLSDFSKFQASADLDRLALEAMAGALEGTGKPLVATSGTALIAAGRLATENDTPAAGGPGHVRMSERVLASAGRGVRAAIVRLPPSVHDQGDHGFVPMLIETARSKGFSAFIGDGANLWPSVHRVDAARVFRLALEKAAPGAQVHGVAEEGIAFSAIAGAIGAGLGVPVRSVSAEEARAHFGAFAGFAGVDNPTSSAITRETLGWQPQETGLLADMKAHYFS